MSSVADKRFLIRSSGHILGPFLKDEVIDLIKKGKISVFDEVAEPYTIWLYLQDHADFKQIVHSVSMQSRLVNFLSSVSTKISQISKNKEDYTTEKTFTKTKEATATLSQLEKQGASEVSVEDIKPIQTSNTIKSDYKSEEESEEIIRKKISFFVNWVWIMIILGVLTIGAYIFYREFYKPMQKKQVIKNQLQSNGFIFYKAGNFKKALSFFEPAYSNELLTKGEKLIYASLLIQENKISKANVVKNEIINSPSFSQGKGRLLESLLDYYNKTATSVTEKKLKSILESNDNNLVIDTHLTTEANQGINGKTEQIESIDQDIDTVTDTARWNLALFYWKAGKDYNKSLSLLNELVGKNITRDIIYYLKALNLLYQNNLTNLESFLAERTELNKEFKQELYLLSAYIYMKKNEKEKLTSQITKLLSEDPFLYQEYSYNSFIIKNTLFNWSYLYKYCIEIFNSSNEDNLFKALYGFCHLKANNSKIASDYITQVKNTNSKNPLFLSLYAYLLMTENASTEQLRQIFTEIDYPLAIERKLPLPFILKARFLESQGNWTSARKTWKQLLSSINPFYLSALAGVAFNSYQLNDIAPAQRYKEQTFNRYPYYIKILPYKD